MMPEPEDVFIRAGAILEVLDIVRARYKEEGEKFGAWGSEIENVNGAIEALDSMKSWLIEQINYQKNT